MLYSGPHSGGYLWLSAVVFTGGRDGIARLAFLEFTASFLVAVGRQKYDTPAGKRELGTATKAFDQASQLTTALFITHLHLVQAVE
ncbi:hypothetical protein AWI13_22485 [Enterobacter hormaechei subsp. xiangfangensis]|nr:hypothetical protein AWI13_22485 [Enterobacter hormaechei subsp. xiangfangensis]